MGNNNSVTINSSRAALATAIAQRDAAQRKVDAAAAAVERAAALVEEAEGRCEETKAALAGRRTEGAQKLLEATTAGAPSLPARGP
jgi:hypothetical protein